MLRFQKFARVKINQSLADMAQGGDSQQQEITSFIKGADELKIFKSPDYLAEFQVYDIVVEGDESHYEVTENFQEDVIEVYDTSLTTIMNLTDTSDNIQDILKCKSIAHILHGFGITGDIRFYEYCINYEDEDQEVDYRDFNVEDNL